MASPPQSALSPGITTPTSAQPSTASISLPSLDILPILVSILSRLKEPSSSVSSLPSASPVAATPSRPPTLTQSQLQVEDSGPLDLKNLPSATDGLKAALARVRQQVAVLPDMRRGLTEQEQEIEGLQKRVEEQRRVLEGLRGWATSGGQEDMEGGKMEGVEVEVEVEVAK